METAFCIMAIIAFCIGMPAMMGHSIRTMQLKVNKIYKKTSSRRIKRKR